MPLVIAFLSALAALEALLASERPAWLARLAWFPLTTTHRFTLPAPTRPAEDASYREPALLRDDAWRRTGPLFPSGLRVVPTSGGDAFAVTGTGLRRDYLARIDVLREGDDVVLTARFTPTPVATAPLLIAVVWAVGRGMAGGLSPIATGMMMGILFGSIAFFTRARRTAEEHLAIAYEALERACVRAASGEPVEPGTDSSRWAGRAQALVWLVAMAYVLVRFAPSTSASDEAVRAVAATYGVDPSDARRLLDAAGTASGELRGHVHATSDPHEIAGLVAAGLRRLDDAEVLELHAIRERLAARSDAVCAGLDSGVVDERAVLHALAREDDATLVAWYRLTTHAARLELDGAGAPPLERPDAVLLAGFDRMVATLPESEREAYSDRLWPDVESDAAACDAFRAMSEGLQRLEPAERARVLRASWTPLPAAADERAPAP